MKPIILHSGFSIKLFMLIMVLQGLFFLKIKAQTDATIYAATYLGLSISTDGGNSFINKNEDDGLGDLRVRAVFVDSNNVYAATYNSLSISTDGGDTFSVRTTANGLGSNSTWDVLVKGNNIFVATLGGLSISTDGGDNFINKTISDGLGSNWIYGVFVNDSNVYAATNGGLSISTDGGNSFTNKTTGDGLGSNVVRDVFVTGSYIYAATSGGLSISTDVGNSFTTKTTENGLGNNNVWEVYADGNNIYAATYGNGLSISTDGGENFINKTSASGLGNDWVYSFYVDDNNIYVALIDGGLSISSDGGESFINKTIDHGLGDNWVFGVFVVSLPAQQLTPEDAITDLISDIWELPLNSNQVDGLVNKLQEALNKLDNGKTTSVIKILEAFINQVQAFINSDKLTTEEGQKLIDAANDIIAHINTLSDTAPKMSGNYLEKNYPNPFNPSTTIRYSIPEEGMVKLEVFNTIGERIAILVDEMKPAGAYEVIFQSKDLPSGIYLCRLKTGDFVEFQKMLLIK